MLLCHHEENYWLTEKLYIILIAKYKNNIYMENINSLILDGN